MKRYLAVVVAVMAGSAACSNDDEAGTAPSFVTSAPTETSSPPGAGVAHRLRTHCGIVSTTVNDVLWLADPPLGDHNPPSGWDENAASGTFTQVSDTQAEFRASAGQLARFRLAPAGAVDPNKGCE